MSRTFTQSTLLTQSALSLGGPERLMLTTPRPVFTASSHTRLPTKPLPPNTRIFGGPMNSWAHACAHALSKLVVPLAVTYD